MSQLPQLLLSNPFLFLSNCWAIIGKINWEIFTAFASSCKATWQTNQAPTDVTHWLHQLQLQSPRTRKLNPKRVAAGKLVAEKHDWLVKHRKRTDLRLVLQSLPNHPLFKPLLLEQQPKTQVFSALLSGSQLLALSFHLLASITNVKKSKLFSRRNQLQARLVLSHQRFNRSWHNQLILN